MSQAPAKVLRVAIACGGTGGHLFPGVAVAQQLKSRGCVVTLLVSQKEIDQIAVQGLEAFEVLALPAVGLARGRPLQFLTGFTRSYLRARRHFRRSPPAAVLAMGGFTSAPPVLAARRLGAPAFLHESNTIPGRANRWLSWGAAKVFTGFPGTGRRLHAKNVAFTGTPVRTQFQPREPGPCRWALGLDPDRPVVLVMGGSQGAGAINRLVFDTLPLLAQPAPDLQWLHLCGARDFDAASKAYQAVGARAVVHPFFREMELALGAATVALSRAGASSLAELAAMRVPPILIPYPAATDDHQMHNARAYQESGAAVLLAQKDADPQALARLFLDLVRNPGTRLAMLRALGVWHKPGAAEQIAQAILESLGADAGERGRGAEAASLRGGAHDAAPPAPEWQCGARRSLKPATPEEEAA